MLWLLQVTGGDVSYIDDDMPALNKVLRAHGCVRTGQQRYRAKQDRITQASAIMLREMRQYFEFDPPSVREIIQSTGQVGWQDER